MLLAAPAAVHFEDAAQSSGIEFVHYKGAQEISTILEEAGPGVCVADFDGDGFEDIYFVNGRNLYGEKTAVRNALYRNNGDGTFTDVTEKANVPGNAYGLGCVWGDYDNDGHPDLYVSQFGKNILYRNNGDGTFTDVTEKAHVDGADFGTVFHTGATFFDYDRDGYLDLYAGGYVEFGPKSRQKCLIGNGVQASCPPSEYKGSPAVLYHNNRDGTFTNVTKAAKVFQPNGKNLSVAASDFDNDGWPDLFVANDGLDVYLYHNERNGTFKEMALTTGVARSANGNTMAAMCLSFGDYDNDGFLDLYISDWQGSGDHIWHNDGQGFLEEVTDRTGILGPTGRVLSFGGGFFDYDNDGRLDLFIANGHVYQGVEKTSGNIPYKQLNTLFHNEGRGKFSDVTAHSGSGFTTPHLGRGVAFADFGNRGSLDVLVANNGDPPSLLRNSADHGNHFINLKLVGTKSNRDGMGARVKLAAGGVNQVREISGGGSYLSQSDLRAHFGVGAQTSVDSIEIAWPSGAKSIFHDVAADRFYRIQEGKIAMDLAKSPRP
ncbi:MAG: CRTAC1 family protein [Bryobacteraceae bacterium]